ncbi:hypothetical protein OC842_001285 [Tilletia horrida]|uniref:RRM domain-containing protein n=1 Tax=Tilletia horrida TaxID=155126 RepID=A0AAN6GGS2_9BASI|nr:hypothetical protein OC842_001285 [Tilletia horrida]
MHLPQDAFLKGHQPFAQPQMGRFPLALNVDLNSNHGGRPRIGGQSAMGGQRHRGVELEPTHKNLYVLNLPLDATTDQLAALFGNYGAVVHCVILAMLDAQARRRGFIDMASPNSAKEAIEALNGFVWHGYPIEVSYAIVQRSGGPFEQANGRHVIKRNVPRNRFNTGPRRVPSDAGVSPMAANRHPAVLGAGAPGPVAGGVMAAANGIVGYDAAMLQHPGGPAVFDPSMGGVSVGAFPPADPQGPHFHPGSAMPPSGPAGPPALAADPRTLFISGLDPVAVLDDEDFRNALEAYGPTQAVSLSRDASGISRGFGMVTFVHEASARKAKQTLDGKMINGRKVSAHHMALGQAGPELLPLSVSTSSASSPTGASAGLPSALSVLDSGSMASSPEYRRTTPGYSMAGTPASIPPSLPGSTPGASSGFGNTTFSTPQPLSTAASSSGFPNYSLPVAPATEGAPQASSSNGRQPTFAYHLGFSPDNWPSTATNKASNLGRRPDVGSPATHGKAPELSGGLAEPFVPRSDSGSVIGSESSQATETARGQDPKAYFLGSAFESPSMNTLSPSTLKNTAGFPGGVFSSAGSRGPLDPSAFDFFPNDSKAENSSVPFPSGPSNSRPLSRASGTLGVTLGADMAASIAAAAVAPPTLYSNGSNTKAGPHQHHQHHQHHQQQPQQSGGPSENSAMDQQRNGVVTESTPKLDGQMFPGSVHSTPLTRRGHGYGHAHMYSHLTRSAGPGGSIGSIGSVSHAGSTSALSAASWARTPQSSLSSLEQISPASGSAALMNGTPGSGAPGSGAGVVAGGSGFKPLDATDDAGEAFGGFGSGDHTYKAGLHSAAGPGTSSDPWARTAAAAWSSPQAVGGPYGAAAAAAEAAGLLERRREGVGLGGAGPSSDSSSMTENGAGHPALRSLHQGSPPYSSSRDASFRKLPLAPVGHEKSASITSPRTRLSSGSNGSGAPGSAAVARAPTYASNNDAGNNVAVRKLDNHNGHADLTSALGGLNIST